MLKQSFVSHNTNALCFSISNPKFNPLSPPKKPNRLASCALNVGLQDVTEVIHNKVLIAAGFSGAIGQLLKPFTSVVFYKKKLDFRTALQAGGFPSTHSSSVVAAATAIAFERGFDDSIFGLTVVYAALIMYDAQGVRREVGKHARVLNKLTANARKGESLESDEISEEVYLPLKESIGHTEVEVIAGALFGFLVSFGVYSLM
ncbi:BnaC01g38600D [Brassica napus]|uniref:Acid phosphatase/vanadium-dependent haloperoxidase-related protein n=3 Tax=Brassica TaxID=3705 RepID=A0A8X7P0M5_BRACI|nr:uncharacterized membrane protein YuiD [Brassica napus]KAG2241239.1 hypothetical protein Bca52824_096776 [Brassica carinata]CAF2079463.1 unnamed protein product [Brassica napus]CDY52670.1 BnaC01g38600D [Brassica napus]VDD52798.1 unnamed protein product [Brassica oleracea]